MNTKTLKALKQGIAKWKRLADGVGTKDENISSDQCSLCNLFFDGGCFGCPVYEKTKISGCHGTPYQEAYRAARSSDWNLQSEKFKAAAKKEYLFLRSLLPKKK